MAQAAQGIVPEVDLHCHILPGWDDGARDLEDALEMARRAAETGIRRIVVTPHVSRPFRSDPYEEARGIPAAVAELQREVRSAGAEIEFVSGAELMLSPELVERVPSQPCLSIGLQGRYVLVEAPSSHWPSYGEQVLFQLSLRGINTIICHAERLPDVQRDPEMLQGMVSRGYLVQVTAGSLAGSWDRHIRRCARRLLEAGLVSLVASDAHSADDMLLREAESAVRSLVGEVRARRILVENPALVLAGRPAPRP